MALPLVYPLVMLGLSLLLVFNVLPIRTRRIPPDHRACDSGAAVHREKLRGVGISIGPEFEEAACVMGASPSRALIDVILPLMRPGILAGMLFAFIVSFNEFTVTFFLYGASTR